MKELNAVQMELYLGGTTAGECIAALIIEVGIFDWLIGGMAGLVVGLVATAATCYFL